MEHLIALLQLPKRVAWPIVFVCILLLWGPKGFNTGLGLDLFINSYRVWVGVVFLFFLAVGLIPLFPWAYSHIAHAFEKRKLIKDAKEKIKNLTQEEKEIFKRYINNNTKTQDLDIQNGVVARLRKIGFIFLGFEVSYGGRRGSYTFPVNITDWAWDYLHEYPELLE